jgi:hypothetical protein
MSYSSPDRRVEFEREFVIARADRAKVQVDAAAPSAQVPFRQREVARRSTLESGRGSAMVCAGS